MEIIGSTLTSLTVVLAILNSFCYMKNMYIALRALDGIPQIYKQDHACYTIATHFHIDTSTIWLQRSEGQPRQVLLSQP